MISAPFSRRIFTLTLLASLASLSCKKTPELPELGTLGSFAFVDQSGRAVNAESLKGQVWIAAFMFTRCPTICPRITQRMKTLQDQLKERSAKVQLVSFTVDPEYDTKEVLAAYATKYGADTSTWSFLTGDFESVKRTAVDGFKMALEANADAGAEHYGILHGSHLVLVDKSLKIRGYYRTSDDSEMKRLLGDAGALADQ